MISKFGNGIRKHIYTPGFMHAMLDGQSGGKMGGGSFSTLPQGVVDLVLPVVRP